MWLREAQLSDVPAMAQIRAADWGTEEYWRERIAGYMSCQLHPRQALGPRVAFISIDGDVIAGLIAGHLTQRFDCDAELQWISVRHEYRGRKIGSGLLLRLSEWFVSQGAKRVCVDVEPSNEIARKFYAAFGAVALKPHWMVWKDIAAVLAKPERDAIRLPR